MNITSQEEDKLVEEKTHLDVIVQMMNIPSEGSVPNSTTLSHEVNQNIATHMIRERQTKRTPHLHLNHRNTHLNQSTNLYHSEHKTYVPKTTNVSTIQSSNNNSHEVSTNHNIPQKINLGWSDPFSVRQFCLSLRASYRLVSTKMIVSRQEDIRSRKNSSNLSLVFEDKAFEEEDNVMNKIY